MDDVVEVLCSGDEVLCSGDSAPSAAWLDEATVAWVDKPNGLYCVARTSSVGTLFVGDARLRLVAKAGRRDFATTCAADAAFLAEIEAWPEEPLRAMKDCLSAHDQQLVSVVRLRRNADKQWGAVVAREAERKRKRGGEYTAAAPARAAQNKRKRERERAAWQRARKPPPTRASHPTPAFVNRHLGHVGGEGPPHQEVAAASASPTRTPRDPMSPRTGDARRRGGRRGEPRGL